jgi:hypothetical protein
MEREILYGMATGGGHPGALTPIKVNTRLRRFPQRLSCVWVLSYPYARVVIEPTYYVVKVCKGIYFALFTCLVSFESAQRHDRHFEFAERANSFPDHMLPSDPQDRFNEQLLDGGIAIERWGDPSVADETVIALLLRGRFGHWAVFDFKRC